MVSKPQQITAQQNHFQICMLTNHIKFYMHAFMYITMLVTLLQESDVINNFQPLWILPRTTLACTWTILILEIKNLFLSRTIAWSSTISYSFFIPYYSEWSQILWLRNSLLLKTSIWTGSLLREGFHPIIAPMLSGMGYQFIMKITIRYHLVLMSKSLINHSLPMLELAVPLIPYICNPWTMNKEFM